MTDSVPFPEAVINMLNSRSAFNRDELGIVCCLVAVTDIDEGHESVAKALDQIAIRSGFSTTRTRIPHYARAVKALEKGMKVPIKT